MNLWLYGSKQWKRFFDDIDINFAYDDTPILTLKDNQDIYNSSKIGISIAHVQAVDTFTWRIIDIMASNACLVYDYHSRFDELFPNIGIPVYNNSSEAYVLCKKLLQDEESRMKIVERCQTMINNNFRFKHFAEKLEDVLRCKLLERGI